jgi:hypothetical protein
MRWLLSVALLVFAGCAQTPEAEWVEGGLYSTRNEDGSYAIVKILKVDEEGVHVRAYSNKFDSEPVTLDETTLYLAGMDHGPDEQLGMGHLPLLKASFAAWDPHYLKTVPVEDSELEGYRMWEEADGGYF